MLIISKKKIIVILSHPIYRSLIFINIYYKDMDI